MNGDLVAALLWSFLTILTVFFAAGFGYVFYKDRDKRKLMFMLAYAFASLSYLPMIQTGWKSIWIMEKIFQWGSLPIVFAVSIAVLSSLLKLKDFDKPFKAFLFILGASISMIVVPLPVGSLHQLLLQAITVIVFVALIYLILTRREISDLMFLLSMMCFTSGGLGMARDLEIEFIVFAFAFAYMFIALVFVTSKESVRGGISSFFALERKLEKTQEELRISQEQLVKAERLAAIGEAATMVGHDLRNPLQSIENAAYLLGNELSRRSPSIPIPQKAREMLQVIKDSINYADKIVRDLQDFASTKKPMLKKTDINTTVKEALSQVEAPENVEIITELGHLPRIEADKDQIKRAFLNLAVNGVQAIENGGRLAVATKKTRDFVEVNFKDTGIGIPKENMEKLFTPFFSTKAKGMGMGLAICKKFVDAHGGSIDAESEVGKGSTFTVKLPIQQNNGGENY